MKKILLLTTGGTIASAPGEDGLEPSLKSGGLAHMIEGITSNYEVDFKDILNLADLLGNKLPLFRLDV